MTQIITTIGPACFNKKTLEFFKSHSVAIARLNCSHNTIEYHEEAGTLARSSGLELLLDLQGPKIRLGEISQAVEIKKGQEIILESAKANQVYPYFKDEIKVFPYEFPVHDFVKEGHKIMIDDGKLEIVVNKVLESSVDCTVNYGGMVKSRKGMNMPNSDLKVSFLQPRDITFLEYLLPRIQPEYVAVSFVKTKSDIDYVKTVVDRILNENSITDYKPKFCAKIEMGEAMQDKNINEIVADSDLLMIARGDLALEMEPLHINVPFNQEKIKQVCKKYNKPFVVATQILESMIESPIPNRSEVSDLYRAVKLDKADYVMLSAESAVGLYPKNCIQFMHDMIEIVAEQDTLVQINLTRTQSIKVNN
jgi:pyruvate kinase